LANFFISPLDMAAGYPTSLHTLFRYGTLI
jgi:hypothetical protein